MHPYLMLALAVLIFTVQTISFKVFNARYMKGLPSYFLFQILHFSVVTVILLIINGGIGAADMLTVFSACAWGIVFVLMLLAYMRAMETGPLSFATLFLSSAVLIPIVWGIAFWGENVTLLQIAGLVLLLFTYYLGAAKTDKAFNAKWFAYVMISFVFNGAMICISKQQQISMKGEQVYEFLIIGFATAIAACACALLYLRLMGKRKSGAAEAPLPLSPGFFAVAGVAGVVTALGNTFAMLLNTRLPSVVQYPVTMGGIVVFTTLVSVVYYKEHLGKRGLAALLLGLVSLVMLSL